MSAKRSPANGEAGDSSWGPFKKETLKMKKDLLLIGAIVLLGVALVACNNTESNMNAGANANANSNTGMMSKASPTATPTPKYTEEQAREEREKAKANKETIGQSLEDAWIHTKLVAKLIGDTKTPERNIIAA